LAQKEKEKKEEHLRQLAQKAREERAGIRTQAAVGESISFLLSKIVPNCLRRILGYCEKRPAIYYA